MGSGSTGDLAALHRGQEQSWEGAADRPIQELWAENGGKQRAG